MTRDDLLRVLRAAVAPDPGKIPDALVDFPGAERGFLVLRHAASLSAANSLEAKDFTFIQERASAAGDDPIVSIEDYIRNVLVRSRGKLELQEIADRLGLSRKTLWEKKKKLGL